MKAIAIKDQADPESLVNIVPTALAQRIRCIPNQYLEMSEAELLKQFSITRVDRLLRIAFHQELDRAKRTDGLVKLNNIFAGVTDRKTFMEDHVGKSARLAYMIRPPVDYELDLEDLLQLGLQELRAIMERPLVDENGRFDHKLAKIKLDTFKDIADRRRGQATQKIETKSLSVSVTKEIPTTPEEIDRELQKLESELGDQPIRDITPDASGGN